MGEGEGEGKLCLEVEMGKWGGEKGRQGCEMERRVVGMRLC